MHFCGLWGLTKDDEAGSLQLGGVPEGLAQDATAVCLQGEGDTYQETQKVDTQEASAEAVHIATIADKQDAKTNAQEAAIAVDSQEAKNSQEAAMTVDSKEAKNSQEQATTVDSQEAKNSQEQAMIVDSQEAKNSQEQAMIVDSQEAKNSQEASSMTQSGHHKEAEPAGIQQQAAKATEECTDPASQDLRLATPRAVIALHVQTCFVDVYLWRMQCKSFPRLLKVLPQALCSMHSCAPERWISRI